MRRRRALVPWLVAAVAVGGALVAWVPDLPFDQLRARWAPAPSTFLTVDAMNVHVRDEGPRDDGEPIVLLHGTAASLHTWDGWAQVLARRRRVIRVDLPGFGLTGPFPDDDYSMARYVAFLGRCLDALRVDRFVLAGNSFGGNVAWHVALAEPGRVSKLILVDSGGYAHASTKTPIGFRIARLPLLSKLVEYILPRSAVESSVRDAYGDPGRVTPALVDRYYELTLRAGNRRALVQRFRQVPAGIDADRIRAIAVPTLVLWGRNDRIVPVEWAQRFHEDIAGSRLVILDGLGHVPQEEDPTRSVEPVEAFLGEEREARVTFVVRTPVLPPLAKPARHPNPPVDPFFATHSRWGVTDRTCPNVALASPAATPQSRVQGRNTLGGSRPRRSLGSRC